ncbi:MAG: AraC family transcriptional regulator [Formosimonas sp.]
MTRPACVFWRQADLPFVEMRTVADGRAVCYELHSHDVFAIGAITAGACDYWHIKSRQTIAAGTVVLMNPHEAHACNPLLNQPWSYVMLYVDMAWLRDLGFATPFDACMSNDETVLAALLTLHATLSNEHTTSAVKRRALVDFFTLLHRTLPHEPPKPHNAKLIRAAEFIDAQYANPVRLTDVCVAANLSAAHLVRAFKTQYGMTPHAYLINRRINHAQKQLKQGDSIAQVAHQLGFADQAHFQRRFKRATAATPEQYRTTTPTAHTPHWPTAKRPSGD